MLRSSPLRISIAVAWLAALPFSACNCRSHLPEQVPCLPDGGCSASSEVCDAQKVCVPAGGDGGIEDGGVTKDGGAGDAGIARDAGERDGGAVSDGGEEDGAVEAGDGGGVPDGGGRDGAVAGPDGGGQDGGLAGEDGGAPTDGGG